MKTNKAETKGVSFIEFSKSISKKDQALLKTISAVLPPVIVSMQLQKISDRLERIEKKLGIKPKTYEN